MWSMHEWLYGVLGLLSHRRASADAAADALAHIPVEIRWLSTI